MKPIDDELLDDVAQTFIGRLSSLSNLQITAATPELCQRPKCHRYGTFILWAWVLKVGETTEAECLELHLCKTDFEATVVAYKAKTLTHIAGFELVNLAFQGKLP